MPRDATVLVIGGGIMGLLTMVLAKKRGAARAILSPIPSPSAGRSRRRLGADHVIDPVRENLRETVKELTGGRGPDVACEAVGKPDAGGRGHRHGQARGIVQLVGVSPKGGQLPIDLYDIHYRELRIQGAYGRGTSFRRALAVLPSLGVDALITARFPLERIADGFAHAAAGQGVKTVITPRGLRPRVRRGARTPSRTSSGLEPSRGWVSCLPRLSTRILSRPVADRDTRDWSSKDIERLCRGDHGILLALLQGILVRC